MRKRLMGFFCAFLLLVCLLPQAAGAATMYFMSVNDKVLEYSPDTLPFISDGVVYVPYTMFLSEFNGGIKLGVFYGWDGTHSCLSLYSQEQPIPLTFDIGAGTAYTKDETFSFRAIMRNSMVFLPARAVCNYFDLTYSYLPTDYGGYLIRVKGEYEVDYYLADRIILSSGKDRFREQKKAFDRSQAAAPVSTPTPTPAPTPTPTPPAAHRQVKVSFAFRCDSGDGPRALLDSLTWYGAKSIFFFRPEDLVLWDDEIRELLTKGHRVGLIVNGADAADCGAQAAEGNRLLGHIAFTRTDFLLVDGAGALREELAAAGWACWWSNIDGVPAEDTGVIKHTSDIRLNLEAKKSLARILMDDSGTSVSTLDRLLPYLLRDEYTLWTVTETEL